jgi:hypothetical protein
MCEGTGKEERKMSNHTPGNWKVGPSGRGGVPVTNGNILIAHFSSLDDAHLGAAAPELLEIAKACDAILRTNTHVLIKHDDSQEAKDGFLAFGKKVEQAIAKAEGRAAFPPNPR